MMHDEALSLSSHVSGFVKILLSREARGRPSSPIASPLGLRQGKIELPSAPDEAKQMTTTRKASKRPEEDPAAVRTHGAPEEQPHAAPANNAGKGKGGPAAGEKRTTASPSRGGLTPAAKAQDAHPSGGNNKEQPHAAPRMNSWDGGGSRSSIFDAAGGGGTRGLDVAEYPQLACMVVSPNKAGGPSSQEMQVEQPHASRATPGTKTGSHGRSVLRQRFEAAAATPDDALPPAETSGAVWREQQLSGGTVHVEAAPSGSMGCPPTGVVHDAELASEPCVGDAASAVDPEFLSKVSISNSSQSSKPPFLWNPYLWYLGHRSGVSPREKHLRTKARGLTTRRLLQAVVWMSVVPELIMQSTKNMLEVWPMLADVTVAWEAPRLLMETEVQPALMWQESFGHCNRHGHRKHRYGDMHERSHRYRDRHRRRERLIDRYRNAWRERDKYAARVGSKPKHRWYSSNTTYLTQRLSWRVQGSGGGV